MKLMMITGANGQIGNYLARKYYAEGYALALLYHNREDRLQDLQDKPGVLIIKVDLQNQQELQTATAKITKFFGTSPEVLIHCAAVRSYDAQPLYLSEPEVFRKIMDANIYGMYQVLRECLILMQEKHYGRVVIFGSDVTQSGLNSGAAYAAAKSAMVSMVKSTAKEMAPYGIVINAISPGPVETALEEDYQGEYLKFRQKYFEDYIQETPTRTLIQKAELKKMVDLLISPDLVNLTGEELLIRGGRQ